MERTHRPLALFCAAVIAAAGLAIAAAQIVPPLSLYGSITDADGSVAAGVPVRAYVGDVLCGAGETELMGEGEGRITFYFVRVWSHEDRPGCGTPDAPVELRIGDRSVSETIPWQARAVEFNITFGDVSPAAIPTFTPIRGGVTSASPESPGPVVRGSSNEGFPVWIAILAVLGAVGLLGGGLGYAMSRNHDRDDDLFD